MSDLKLSRKVAYFSCFPEFGGGEVTLLTQLKYLDRSKFEPVVVSPAIPQMIDRLERLQVGWYELPTTTSLLDHGLDTRFASLSRYRDAIGLQRRLVSLLRRLSPDVVHAVGSRSAKLLILPCKALGIPLTWSGHNTRDSRLTDRWLPRLTDASAFVSQAVRDVHLRSTANNTRCQVIYNGVDLSLPYGQESPEVRVSLGLPSTVPLVGLVGRIAPNKGHHLLVQAALQVIEEHGDVRFLFVGQADSSNQLYAERLAHEIEALRLDDYFIWTGFRTDVPAIMSELSMLTLPTSGEGFPMTVIEAMAASRPVVATRIPVIAEAVLDGVTGLLVSPGDPSDLASAIKLLLDEPVRRTAMGIAGRKRVEEQFDASLLIHKYESQFTGVLR